MLARLITLLCTVAFAVVHAGPAIDRMFLGTWRDDISDPTTRISFRPDHSFVMQAGEPLVTFIEGTWRIEDGQLFISRVTAAGEPLPEASCGQRVVSATENKIVVRGIDAENKSVTTTYTRVR